MTASQPAAPRRKGALGSEVMALSATPRIDDGFGPDCSRRAEVEQTRPCSDWQCHEEAQKPSCDRHRARATDASLPFWLVLWGILDWLHSGWVLPALFLIMGNPNVAIWVASGGTALAVTAPSRTGSAPLYTGRHVRCPRSSARRRAR